MNSAVSGTSAESKVVWWVMGIVASLAVAGICVACGTLFTMNGRLSGMEAKVDLILADRPPCFRRGPNGTD